MSRISIISVGNELLSGQCVDTNRAWLGNKLFTAGFEVVSGFTVGDEIDIVSQAIGQAAEQADIVLITGGLGPTDDDLTRQAVADFLGVELEFSQDLFDEIKAYFAARKYPMVDRNRVQAFLPAGAEPLHNSVGTAPGFAVEKGGKLIAAMPGVPSEMKQMFKDQLFPIISERNHERVVSIKRVKCFGIGESSLAEKLGKIMERGQNPLVNCTVKQGVITLHVVATSGSREGSDAMIDSRLAEIQGLIGEYILGVDEKGLEEIVAEGLTKAGKRVALAESCTGGLIAKMLTDLPGASAYFDRGWVTYSNEAKHEELGVSEKLLEDYGAVSSEVAQAMAKGALKNSGCDVAVSVTGIAGPGGGTEQKPVGLVYISMAYAQKCVVKEHNFPKNREVCRLRTAQAALDLIIKEFLVKI